MNLTKLLLFALLCGLGLTWCGGSVHAANVPEMELASVIHIYTAIDTIPIVDRSGDFITNGSYNPFDITPDVITQEVEYDPINNRYIIIEKIGDEYYRPPTYLTFDEYVEWKKKEDEKKYYNNLSGISTPNRRNLGLSGKLDPMDKVDITQGLVDRIFGGTEVNIKPQGSVDLTLELLEYRRTIGPNVLTSRQANQLFIPSDFRLQPRLNVDGSIGKKLNLGFNYDNSSTFNFDQKIKLDYAADAFNEDDIIKKIEAGNVSLPLKSNLIQGAQNLFGFKTELQFGHLRITGLLSQQRSRRNNLQIQNGASTEEFDLYPTDYDENRHFFLTHYNRNNYEDALSNLPFIKSSFRISQIEVWISSDRRDQQDRTTLIAGVSDLGKGDLSNYDNQRNSSLFPYQTVPVYLTDLNNNRLPDNNQNPIYDLLTQTPNVNDQDKVTQYLSGLGLEQTNDFEVFNAKLLNPSEYTYNPQLGTISLNIRLRPNDKLAVAFRYYFTDRCDSVYTVGQIANEGLETSEPQREGEEPSASKVIFAKLLKSSQQSTVKPSWDLMMKNVYNLRTNNLTREGFSFDIFYEDDFDDGSLKKYLPIEKFDIDKIPLLNIFNLDTLNRFGDPQSDGVIDFVPGVTVIERTGSIVFPVLEPFGSSLSKVFNNDPLLDSLFTFQMLYDTTSEIARSNFQEKNKFLMRAQVENAQSNEYFLGPGVTGDAVRVTAGGIQLIEGVDYEIDLGRLRIINPAYLNQGTPVNVSFEDNGAFNLNQKVYRGLRLDYDLSKKLSLGATYLNLKERPFSQKVNVGEDPINNQIFGIDFNYKEDLPWLTSVLDKLPFYSTKAPSSLAWTAEAAYLRPGTNRSINTKREQGGVVGIDDFEGAVSGFTLGGFNLNDWTHASTPWEYPEHNLVDDLDAGVNRARLSWYSIDPTMVSTTAERNHPYTRIVDIQDLFDRPFIGGQLQILPTFDISYFPNERGIYNFDLPQGTAYSDGIEIDPIQEKVFLKNPESRWGGLMRNFQNTDFQAANYEFIEFWMLNPFMDRPDGIPHAPGEEGEIVFHLGNVSEDIMKDGLQFYENGIDTSANISLRNTAWGRVSLRIPINTGFDLDKIDAQDLGLDGMDNGLERSKYAARYGNLLVDNPFLALDPAGDDYRFYNDETFKNQVPDVIERLKYFNNPEGNAPRNSSNALGTNASQFRRGNAFPEDEDLNKNRALDNAEAFHKYVVKVKNLGGEIDTTDNKYYRQLIEVTKNGVQEKWYRFQIPLNAADTSININNFRSIQFMRMFFTKFSSAKTFRLVDFQLIRNQWRRSDPLCFQSDVKASDANLYIDVVGVFDNKNRKPFGYVTPDDIRQEIFPGTIGGPQAQDERSMVLRYDNLFDNCQVAVNKVSSLNLNLYKNLQMFIHLEEENDELEYGDISAFVKLGKDLKNNYYEYQIPLQHSLVNISNPNAQSNIWPDTNFINFNLESFRTLKQMKLQGIADPSLDFGAVEMEDPDNPGAKFIMKGTPSLGNIKILEVGVRNTSGDKSKGLTGQIWVNDLRCTGLEERGGVAVQSRAQIKLADFGDINIAGNYSSIGYGALDQRLQERAQEETVNYDIATSLQLGKLLPEKAKITIPFLAQYSKSITTPRFDPYQLDLTTEQVVNASEPQQAAEIRERARETTTIKSYNFTNVKVDVGSGKMPWHPKNLSATYSFTETDKTTPIIKSEKETERKLGLDYRFTTKPLYISPFKAIKSKNLKILSDFGLNLIPNTFGFNTHLNRFNNSKLFRLPVSPVFQFDDQRFRWDRNYNLDWDITKALRFTYKAQTASLIDELRQVGIATTPEERRWINEVGEDFTASVNDDPATVNRYRNENLRNLGRSKNYTHDIGLTYRVPFKNIPILDWVNVSADYKANYGWLGGSLITIDNQGNLLGNTIQNTQDRSINATFSFDKLYSKVGYLKKIENPRAAARSRSRSRSRTSGSKDGRTPLDDDNSDDRVAADDKEKKDRKKDKNRVPSATERALIRPLLLLRDVRFQYRENFGTMIPGFMPESQLLGLSEGFASPGWDFIVGLQPDLDNTNSNNWLYQNQGWFNPSANFNDQISQNTSQTIGAKIGLEPFKDFDIDIDFNKEYRKNHTEIFKQLSKDGQLAFAQQAFYDVGSFTVTHYGLNTLFKDNQALYETYKKNRETASRLLPNKANAGTHQQSEFYKEGYGPLNYQVNVMAFLTTYTGQDTNQVSNNLTADVSRLNYLPKPNWQLRYDGLSKLKIFKDKLKSFQLKHGYKSTLSAASFNTNPLYDDALQFTRKTDNGDYYAQIEIPTLSITEQFNPIIGVSMKTASDLSLNMEWKKSRTMNLNLQSSNLSEDLNNEFVLGFGYIFKDFKGFTKKKKKRAARKNPGDEDDTKKDGGVIDLIRGGKVDDQRGRTLTINMDLSFRDNKNLIYNLDDGAPGEANRGNKTLSIEPSAEYQMYKNLAFRWYARYSNQSPYNNNSNQVTQFATGVTARFTFK